MDGLGVHHDERYLVRYAPHSRKHHVLSLDRTCASQRHRRPIVLAEAQHRRHLVHIRTGPEQKSVLHVSVDERQLCKPGHLHVLSGLRVPGQLHRQRQL